MLLSLHPEVILMRQSLQTGSPSLCMALWIVLCAGEQRNMASSRGEKTSTILFASRTRITGCTWPLVHMMAAPLDELDEPDVIILLFHISELLKLCP